VIFYALLLGGLVQFSRMFGPSSAPCPGVPNPRGDGRGWPLSDCNSNFDITVWDSAPFVLTLVVVLAGEAWVRLGRRDRSVGATDRAGDQSPTVR